MAPLLFPRSANVVSTIISIQIVGCFHLGGDWSISYADPAKRFTEFSRVDLSQTTALSSKEVGVELPDKDIVGELWIEHNTGSFGLIPAPSKDINTFLSKGLTSRRIYHWLLIFRKYHQLEWQFIKQLMCNSCLSPSAALPGTRSYNDRINELPIRARGWIQLWCFAKSGALLNSAQKSCWYCWSSTVSTHTPRSRFSISVTASRISLSCRLFMSILLCS